MSNLRSTATTHVYLRSSLSIEAYERFDGLFRCIRLRLHVFCDILCESDFEAWPNMSVVFIHFDLRTHSSFSA